MYKNLARRIIKICPWASGARTQAQPPKNPPETIHLVFWGRAQVGAPGAMGLGLL